MKTQLCPKCKTVLSRFNELSNYFSIDGNLLRDLKKTRSKITVTLPAIFNCNTCKNEKYQFNKNDTPPSVVICKCCNKKKATYNKDENSLIIFSDQIIGLKVGSAVIRCPQCKTHYNLNYLRQDGSDIEINFK